MPNKWEMRDKTEATLESAEYITRLDITQLFLNLRDEAGIVMRALKSKDRALLPHYRNFLEMFFKLYKGLKYNVPLTKKIPTWEKQTVILEKLFDYWDKTPPEIMLKYWDWFHEVCVKTGIYNLSKETYIAEEGFEEEIDVSESE